MSSATPDPIASAPSPKGMRAVVIAFGLGTLSAMLFASITTGSPLAFVLIYIAGAPLGIAALGLPAGLLGIAGATALLVLIPAGSWILAAVYAALVLVPALALGRAALSTRVNTAGQVVWSGADRVVLAMIALGVLAVAGLAAIGFGTDAMTERLVAGGRAQLAEMMAQPSLEVESVLRLMVQLPALICLSWFGMLMVVGLLAQTMVRKLDWAQRPPLRLTELELPRWLIGATAVAGIIGVAASGTIGFLGQNVAVILGVAFVFGGLAVLHALAKRSGRRGLVLGVAYGAILVFVWPLALVALVGLVDQVMQFRQKLMTPPDRG